MTVEVINAWPSAAVAAGGTFTIPYPSGRSSASYVTTSAELAIPSQQAVRSSAEGGITLSFGASNITVNYVSGPTIAAGAKVALQVTLQATRAEAGGEERAPILAALGDSITYNALGITNPTFVSWSMPGYLTWVRILSRGRVCVPNDYNFGVSGQTTAQILARVGDVVAARPGVCIVLAGTNDAVAGSSASTIANLDAIYNRLQANGIRVIAVPILVRGDVSAAIQQTHIRVNNWISAQRFIRRDFAVADASLYWTDPATGAPRAASQSDFIHPNAACSYFVAKEIVKCLEAWYPMAPANFVHPGDVYSTNNPTGNLIAAGTMAGTTGVLSNGFTGQLATGWTANGVNTPAGAAAAFSKVAKADGRVFQQIAFSGSYNSAAPAGQQVTGNIGVTNISAGDVLEMTAEIEVDADVANMAYVGAALQLTGASGRTAYDCNGAVSDVMPVEAWNGVLRTPRFVVPAGATGLSALLRWNIRGVAVASTLAATVRFGSVAVRKVA